MADFSRLQEMNVASLRSNLLNRETVLERFIFLLEKMKMEGCIGSGTHHQMQKKMEKIRDPSSSNEGDTYFWVFFGEDADKEILNGRFIFVLVFWRRKRIMGFFFFLQKEMSSLMVLFVFVDIFKHEMSK